MKITLAALALTSVSAINIKIKGRIHHGPLNRVQLQMKYDTSEGPTKADNGELDQVVVSREHDIGNGFKYGGYGLTAWHNPLADADGGQDDDTVVLQIRSKVKYDTSEGPTKADNGELDQVVVSREHDIGNGFKYGGYGLTAWHNPLADADGGQDDDTVVLQIRSKMRYDQSEGPTKVDNGELDEVVTHRESDIANGFKYGGYGLTAWHNPLSDADDGQDDENILTQTKSKLRYDTSEGPTKVDNGELDEVVTHRESDIANGFKYGGYGLTAWHNPLADADDGQDDESILTQLKSKVNQDEDQLLSYKEAEEISAFD